MGMVVASQKGAANKLMSTAMKSQADPNLFIPKDDGKTSVTRSELCEVQLLLVRGCCVCVCVCVCVCFACARALALHTERQR